MPGTPFQTSSAVSRNPRSLWVVDEQNNNVLATTGWQFVRDLQAKVGVPVDGAWGPDTNRALVARLTDIDPDVLDVVDSQTRRAAIDPMGLLVGFWFTYLRDRGVSLGRVQFPPRVTPPTWRVAPPAPTRVEALQVWPYEPEAPPPPPSNAPALAPRARTASPTRDLAVSATTPDPLPPVPSPASASGDLWRSLLDVKVAGVPVVPVGAGLLVGGTLLLALYEATRGRKPVPATAHARGPHRRRRAA